MMVCSGGMENNGGNQEANSIMSLENLLRMRPRGVVSKKEEDVF